MSPPATLLTTRQMVEFVARGFLEFPGLLDGDLADRVTEQCSDIAGRWGTATWKHPHRSGTHWTELYPDSALGEVIRHPVVAGAIRSLVGPEARFDHDFVHHRPPRDPSFQPLHCDCVVDPHRTFDLQIFVFPHEVAPGEGGTGFVPGSHLRLVNESDIGRYRHLRGERQWSGPAGSVLLFHQGLWHRALPNPGERHRLMYKLRLNPTQPQVRLWDVADLHEINGDPDDHLFSRYGISEASNAFRGREPWMGLPEHRLTQIARARLWRNLTGDMQHDTDWYLTRLDGHAAIDAEGEIR